MKKQLKDLDIEYHLSGEQNTETIVFVHGLGANLSQFKLQHDFFSEKLKVLSVNLRGHGNSKLAGNFDSSDFKLSKMAHDIIELLNKLDINKIHYVGNSMGGNVGYEILKSKPQIISSFTTFGTTAQLNTSNLTLGLMKFTYKFLSLNFIAHMSKVAGQTKSSKEQIQEMIRQSDKSVIRAILPNLANFNYLTVIQNSSAPTMIIKGAQDHDINKSIDSTISEFNKRGHFKLSKLQEAGHFANLDAPVLFNQTLENFIYSVS
ncbi:alpha/beta hydrolase [bacterium SCSIO 12643]|nr:alpha/beta hydrolase [bacterium SCSIO 12643]